MNFLPKLHVSDLDLDPFVSDNGSKILILMKILLSETGKFQNLFYKKLVLAMAKLSFF